MKTPQTHWLCLRCDVRQRPKRCWLCNKNDMLIETKVFPVPGELT